MPSDAATTDSVPDPDATAPPDPQATTDQAGRADALGTVIAGKYKLTEPLGEGGMGTVYLARQSEPVRRFVAVKLIKTGLDSKAVLARFEAERQALAMMDHPNIARVLDAGATADGRPYFVMELVPGTPITTYCDAHRLTTRQRLELFVPVCKAIQHAHQKGVIHRDIKPSNVLVTTIDDRPVPKVIDFGIAKATGQPLTDSTLETNVGALVGTPEYMSPEQASLDRVDIDTRSDVYALGVLLYELLTGSTPVDRKSLGQAAILEVLRIVREVEPPRPSDRLSAADGLPSIAANRTAEPKSLCRLMRGELDWVALKALEKDRARRYDTVNALARDIERYLADEVVEARPPTAGYRLLKLVRRNKGRAAAAALVLAALVAGLGGTTWGLIRAKAEATRATTAEEHAVEQAKFAEKERDNALVANDRARTALGSFTDELMQNLLVSKASLTEPEKAVLKNALKQWEVFASAEGDTLDAREARGGALNRVAFVQAKLGLTAEAVKNYRAAIAVREQLVAEAPGTPLYRLHLASSHNNLGLLLVGSGDRAGAEQAHRAGLSLDEKLMADYPGVPKYRLNLASSHNNLGLLLVSNGDREGAERGYRAAIVLLEQLVAEAPGTLEYGSILAASHNNLGSLLSDGGDRAGAERAFRAAIVLHERLVAEAPGTPQYRDYLANHYNNLGYLLNDGGDRAGAEQEHRAALALREKLAADAPGVPVYRSSLASSQQSLGLLLSDCGDRAGAERAYRAALALQEKLAVDAPGVPEYRSNLAASYNNLGNLLSTGVDRAGAEKAYLAALALWERLAADAPGVPEYRSKLGTSHTNLGSLLADRGDRAGAENAHRAATGLCEKLVADAPGVPDYQVNLGGSYCNFGNMFGNGPSTADSLEWYGRAVRTLTPVYVKSPELVTARHFLRNSYMGRARAHHALDHWDGAIADWDQAIEMSPPEERSVMRASRADDYLKVGRFAEAVAEAAELTKSDIWTASARYDFACIYSVASDKIDGKREEYAGRAVELLRQAVAKGYSNVAHMSKDTDLDPLRERADFRLLVADLAKKFPPPAELAPPPRPAK